MNVSVDLIKPSPYQPRLVFDLEELRGSILKHGIIEPLKVRKVKDYYELVDGERRWRIARQEDFKTIPCIIVDFDDEEADAVAWKLNTERLNYSLEEKAKHFRKHQKEGMSGSAIGRVHGYSKGVVNSYLAIFRLPEEYQNYVWAGELPFASFEYLYAKGLFNGNFVLEAFGTERLLQQAITLKTKEFIKVVDDYILKLKEKQVKAAQKAAATIEASEARIDKAKRELGEPQVKQPESAEDLEKAANALKREAKRRRNAALSPEEKAKREAEKKRKAEERKLKREIRKGIEEEKRKQREAKIREQAERETATKLLLSKDFLKGIIEDLDFERDIGVKLDPEIIHEARKRFDELKKETVAISSKPESKEKMDAYNNWMAHGAIVSILHNARCPICQSDWTNLLWTCHKLNMKEADSIAHKNYQKLVRK